MEKILMHCPINISRAFSNLINEFIQKEYPDSQDFTIHDEPHRLNNEHTLTRWVKEGIAPSLYIGHATDFGRFSKQEITNSFDQITGLPLGKNLQEIGFEDTHHYFHPFTVIPFGVIYNKDLAGNSLPTSWSDFQTEAYNGKILIPDRERTISRVVLGTMKSLYPDTYKKFIDNCSFHGSPIDVVNSIDQGEYQYGMVNIAFSRFSRLKNTGIVWLKEGAFCMPQIVAIGKGKTEIVKKIVDYIFSPPIQDFLALQGFIPAMSGQIPEILNHEDLHLIWNGWEEFLKTTA